MQRSSTFAGCRPLLSLALWALYCLSQADERTIRMGQISDPHTLNPFQVHTADSAFISQNIFEPLLVVDADGQPKPAQAEKWRFDNGGKRVIFTLRQGLKWSDGSPLVAQDFVAGLRYLADPTHGFVMAEKLKTLRILNAEAIIQRRQPVTALGVSAPDKHQVVVELESPVSFALPLLASLSYPLHRPTQTTHGERWAKVGRMVVNGAYLPEKWVMNDRLELIRNRHYRNANQVLIDRAVLYPLSPAAELKRYQADCLDITRTVVSGRTPWLRSTFGTELHIYPIPATYFYLFNLDNPRLQSRQLRQALAQSLNRQQITDRVLGLGQKPSLWFAPADSVKLPQSQSLLRHNMGRDGTKGANSHTMANTTQIPTPNPPLEILYNTMDSHQQIALAVSDMWKQTLNINTSLRNVEWNTLADEINHRTFDLARLGWAMGDPDPCLLYIIFTSTSSLNQTGYRNPAFDQAFQETCYQPDPVKRQQGILQMEQTLARDMPAIPVFHPTEVRLIKSRVKGMPKPGQYPYFRIQDLWLEQD